MESNFVVLIVSMTSTITIAYSSWNYNQKPSFGSYSDEISLDYYDKKNIDKFFDSLSGEMVKQKEKDRDEKKEKISKMKERRIKDNENEKDKKLNEIEHNIRKSFERKEDFEKMKQIDKENEQKKKEKMQSNLRHKEKTSRSESVKNSTKFSKHFSFYDENINGSDLSNIEAVEELEGNETLDDDVTDLRRKTCQNNRQCEMRYSNPSMECVNGTCQEEKCKSNSVCPMDTLCIKGNCIDVAMGDQRKCQDKNKCPPNYVCYVERKLCIYAGCNEAKDCPGNMDCFDHSCVSQTCNQDSDCPYREQCYYGKCLKMKKNLVAKICHLQQDCFSVNQTFICAKRGSKSTGKCLRYPCKSDLDCPEQLKCHQDFNSKFCSGFICKKSSDCNQGEFCLKDSQGKCLKLRICTHQKCDLPSRCVQDLDCSNSRLCERGVCSKISCKSDLNCPSRSKCNKTAQICRNMNCQRHSDCEKNDEKCQIGLCVSRSGGQCQDHLHCPQFETCVKNQCQKVKCKTYQDCAQIHKSLMCHPDGVCTAHEDASEGAYMYKAMREFSLRSLLVKPKPTNQFAKIDQKELKTQMDSIFKSLGKQFPSEKELFESGEKEKIYQEKRSMEDLYCQRVSCKNVSDLVNHQKLPEGRKSVNEDQHLENIIKENDREKTEKRQDYINYQLYTDYSYNEGQSVDSGVSLEDLTTRKSEIIKSKYFGQHDDLNKNKAILNGLGKENKWNSLEELPRRNNERSLEDFDESLPNFNLRQDERKINATQISSKTRHNRFSDEPDEVSLHRKLHNRLGRVKMGETVGSLEEIDENNPTNNEEKSARSNVGSLEDTDSKKESKSETEQAAKEGSLEGDDTTSSKTNEKTSRHNQAIETSSLEDDTSSTSKSDKKSDPEKAVQDGSIEDVGDVTSNNENPDKKLKGIGVEDDRSSLEEIDEKSQKEETEKESLNFKSEIENTPSEGDASPSTVDPLRKFTTGDPNLVAYGEHGELLQTVTESLAKLNKLSSLQTANALSLEKLPDSQCIWRRQTNRDKFEFVPGCKNKTFGETIRYRTHSGVCNNLRKGRQYYGTFGLPFDRLLTADYFDGVNKFRRSRADSSSLPNPRTLSNRIALRLGALSRNRKVKDSVVNAMFIYFAQFVDHDMTNTFPKPITPQTPVFGALNKQTGLNCCGPSDAKNIETFIPRTEKTRPWCISIKIHDLDPFWKKRSSAFKKTCLHQQVTRAVPDYACHLGARQIMSQVTSWLDLSQIYNSKRLIFNLVNRDKTTKYKLEVSPGDGSKQTMPRCPITTPPAGFPPTSCISCLLSTSRSGFATNLGSAIRNNCFIGGDFRTDENIALSAMQTLWVREHNRIADELKKSHPAWDDETLFQETRRITIAEYQHIIYNEFLPPLIGPSLMRKFKLRPLQKGYNNQYDPTVEPSIANVFATASFRFGHAMLPDRILPRDPAYKPVPPSLDINDVVFRFDLFSTPPFLSNFIRGLMTTPAGRADGFFAEKARDVINLSADSVPAATNVGGFDLLAWNINRGRDHGLPPYHMWIKLTTGENPRDWNFFVKRFTEGKVVVPVFRRLYRTWKDLDLYLAGLIEQVPKDARGIRNQVIGPTHATIIGTQFARLRRADRFFYESGDTKVRFAPNELREIKKITMAHILCHNMNHDGVPTPLTILEHPFLRPRKSNESRVRKKNVLINCNELIGGSRRIDYSIFKPVLTYPGPKTNKRK